LHRSQLITTITIVLWRKIHRITVQLFVPFLDLSVIGEQVPLVWLPSQPHLTGGPTPPLEKILLNFSDPVFLAYFLFDFLISDFSFVFPTVLQECDYQNHQSDSSGGHPCLDPCHTVSSASLELEAPQIKTLDTALLALLCPEIWKQPLTWLSRPRGFLARLRAEVPSALT
jgi:hypothetical protein